MLGKKELTVILVVLFCVVIYYAFEYVYYQKGITSPKPSIVENFQTNANSQRKLDAVNKLNINLFTFLKKISSLEHSLYSNDIKIANTMIKEQFNLRYIIMKEEVVDGDKFFLVKKSFKDLLNKRYKILDEIITTFSYASASIVNTNHDNEFYHKFKKILDEFNEIYKDNRKYLIPGSNNYFDLEKLIEAYNHTNKIVAGVGGVTEQASSDKYEYINSLLDILRNTKDNFRKISENIEKMINELLDYINSNINFDKLIKPIIIQFFQNRLDILSKSVVRNLTFDIYENLLLLTLSETPSPETAKDKIDATKESNKVVVELLDFLITEQDIHSELLKLFKNDNKNIVTLLSDDEQKYFNTVGTNNKMLVNFCKKIKKVDRPNNSNYLFKRLAREYIDKKNDQIEKLNKQIDNMMGAMTLRDAYNQNLYVIRTNDDAQKQMNAIKEAKENIDNMDKIKLNIN